jgi:hypothetical protein
MGRLPRAMHCKLEAELNRDPPILKATIVTRAKKKRSFKIQTSEEIL